MQLWINPFFPSLNFSISYPSDSVCLWFYLFIHLAICLSTHFSLCLSVCVLIPPSFPKKLEEGYISVNLFLLPFLLAKAYFLSFLQSPARTFGNLPTQRKTENTGSTLRPQDTHLKCTVTWQLTEVSSVLKGREVCVFKVVKYSLFLALANCTNGCQRQIAGSDPAMHQHPVQGKREEGKGSDNSLSRYFTFV